VITAVTAQSDSRVTAVHHIPPEVIRAQVAAAFETRQVEAIKIGMLGTRATVDAVAGSLQRSVSVPIVLDPVLVSSSGGVLLDTGGIAAGMASGMSLFDACGQAKRYVLQMLSRQ
jgi:hydroxymethylpyrimidine/phosphomethylpyrimidine kinase